MKRSWWMMLMAAWLGAGCSSVPEIPAVCGFELQKYLGKWYEISRLPNWFERGMSEVTAEYFPVDDGSIRVINRGIKNGREKSISGYARFAGKSDVGELEVSFFRPFYSPYRIIKLASDYRYSVVTDRDGDYLWVLSRTPQLPQEDMDEIFRFLSAHGFETERLIP